MKFDYSEGQVIAPVTEHECSKNARVRMYVIGNLG